MPSRPFNRDLSDSPTSLTDKTANHDHPFTTITTHVLDSEFLFEYTLFTTMPKRKTSSTTVRTQHSLSNYLPTTKPSKRVKKEASSLSEYPDKNVDVKDFGVEEINQSSRPSEKKICLSESVEVNGTSEETARRGEKSLARILEMIDEVLNFAGKGLLWSHIQEEIYSLHKRYVLSLDLRSLDSPSTLPHPHCLIPISRI